MRRIFTLVTLLLAGSSFLMAGSWKGAGTAADPYQVGTAAQLDEIRTIPAGEATYFILTADIDLSTLKNRIDGTNEWYPLNDDPYTRIINIDGNGHVIKNLKSVNINATNPDNGKTRQYSGLYGVLCGTVKNLGIIDAKVVSVGRSGIIGGYIGHSKGGAGIISNCHITGSVEGTRTTGGIGGIFAFAGSKVENCYTNVNVLIKQSAKSDTEVGGIMADAAKSPGGEIINCIAEGTVKTIGSAAGGITGKGNVNNCVAMNTSVETSTSGQVGRIVGLLNAKAGSAYALSTMTLKKGSSKVNAGSNTASGGAFDGTSKSAADLAKADTYKALLGSAWGTTWSAELFQGKPALSWYAKKFGTANEKISVNTNVNIVLNEGTIYVNGDDVKSIYVYSISGALVTKADNVNQVSLLAPKGIYIVKVNTEAGIATQKVIKR